MVSTNIRRLAASEGALVLTVGDRGWTTVVLERAGTKEQLGSEDMGYLSDHLRAFLEQPTDELRWVLTLSETHTTMYGAGFADGTILRCQDRDARFFADLRISVEERQEWLAQLRRTGPE